MSSDVIPGFKSKTLSHDSITIEAKSFSRVDGWALPAFHRVPLIDHLVASKHVVALEAGSGKTGVIGDDADARAGTEGFDPGA